jgi:citrate lyase subunit gamma (acyl carrier protein)
MEITSSSSAGTLESSDVYVEVSPGPGIELDLSSAVMAQFGDSIKTTMMEVIREMGVQNVHVRAHDRGALDCVIRSRLKTALLRGGKGAAP